MGRRDAIDGSGGSDLRTLLAGPVPLAARGLLGCVVTAGDVAVRLTEVEAYGGVDADPASHAHRGRTRRNAVMFGPAGHLYVYFTYGMHWCGNVVTGAPGEAAAVLLRAGEVISGHGAARGRRGPAVSDRDLARGPARLMVALGLDGAVDGVALLDGAGPVTLSAGAPVDPARIRSGPRVGVARAVETPWRFWLDGEPTVSPYRRAVPRSRRSATRPTAADAEATPGRP
ncbi:DNA-3-methyladenine glycosylase [Solwaraspora sp. WMMD406]|uniref:DNA-3-methyladenine glycosylase n=1 Tax=Solwaraspora sp. WMMD406 TaxID=3016095 RepID=UPI002417D43F|nr:DNA-3-methyladenine glycosylase [Solwaraspora sp. WMMD406]MDG4766412.1 DNA-3-methyladenine glycosylase [Solwaraspora sp. WMMD406]